MSAKKSNKKGNSKKSNNQSSKKINNQNDLIKKGNKVAKENENKNIDTKEKSNVKKQINSEKNVQKSSLEQKQEKNISKKVDNKINDQKNVKSKEEEIVFKNSKFKEKDSFKNKKQSDKSSDNRNKQENEKTNDDKLKQEKIAKEKLEKKELSKEEKSENSKKRLFIIILITVILVVLLIFSTCFALVHATKNTIARGVSIKNIDISNLTYNEAKSKLEDAFNVELGVNMNLKYEDFSYIVASTDINLTYELNSYLEEAYNIGRSGNILQNNYDLIYTALFNKNIDFEFSYDENALNTIIEYVATNVPNLVKQYSYYIEGEELVIIPGVDGIEVNKDELRSQILEKVNNRTAESNENQDEELEIPYKEVTAADIDIEKIYNEIKAEPQNAYYVEATEDTEFEIHADVDGVDFAISLDEAKQIISQEGVTEYRIPLNITKAEVTINDIGIEAFPYKISTFQTTYDASNISRSENLRIASNKINGTVIMPGKQFSFNEVVGERTVSEGYQNAKIYSDGQVVDGLAGGICQVSSTLYNAVLLANLQIDERYNHSFTTSYVEPGRDATVVYGVKDFKFTNTRSFPIKIEASVANGVATFSIYGIKEENEYTVKILPVKTETTPFTTQTITDASLAPGTTAISQAGASGCKVTTYKEVYLNNAMISRDAISNDVYQVMTRIVRVGPDVTPTVAPAPVETAPETPAVETPEQVPEVQPEITEGDTTSAEADGVSN